MHLLKFMAGNVRPLRWCGVVIAVLCATTSWAVTLSWDPPQADDIVEGYHLYRAPGNCAASGPFTKVQSVGLVTTMVAVNPSANGVYCHKLTAFNVAGESGFSNAVEARYIVNPPHAPQSLGVMP